MTSSARYEDLKEELFSVKEKVKTKLKQGITEGNLNNALSEGDGIVLLMKKEVDLAPLLARSELLADWTNVNREWSVFKITCRTNPGSLIGGPSISNPDGRAIDFESNMNLMKGVSILERTNESVTRATQVARESEQIGTAVIEELGDQREALLRTRGRLHDTGQELKKTHAILRVINRRVITNKCLLIIIIILELLILGGLIYWKWVSKWIKH
ncbi:Vesicle transport through interaction with t-SNAREs 1B-like protein [Dinothrombium tinctorium]|uniref:Vesicle transport through interaction with t-SNAREs 1B-like protein n=1 Tax=Dinothrombium tinctorium TaxID=1965070 RepID=A0A3S4QV66_9ACAR|nr:Vesicle transport through interaction with t-SNAREs 1B-like protein [Dinothrombium tinctorium]